MPHPQQQLRIRVSKATENHGARVLPVLQSLVWFGLDRIDLMDGGPVSPLNGFLAGILLASYPLKAGDLDATYRVEIDSRRFEFAVDQGHLAALRVSPR